MDRIGIVNYSGSIAAGIAVKELPSIWIVLGKTSAWDNEDSPDSPLPGNNNVVEPFVAISPAILSMSAIVTLDEYNALGDSNRTTCIVGDTLVYLQLVDDVDAYDSVAKYLYIRAVFDPIIAQMPSADYFRVYYAVFGLIPAAGHENAPWISDANVESYGRILYENSGTKQQGTGMMDIPLLLEFN